jgi:hypothetical protein
LYLEPNSIHFPLHYERDASFLQIGSLHSALIYRLLVSKDNNVPKVLINNRRAKMRVCAKLYSGNRKSKKRYNFTDPNRNHLDSVL